MSNSDLWLISAVVLVPAVLLWLIFIARSGRPSKPRIILGIPRAMRPGQPDEVLEGPRLEKVMVGGLVATAALAVFVPMYWLPEADRQESFAERQEHISVENGAIIFSSPPPLIEPEEAGDPEEFKEHAKGEALAQNCQQCHGAAEGDDPSKLAAGGAAPYQDPITGENVQYQAPPLQNVFTRWDDEVVELTIKRGRPGTPMPAWGVEYGGSMTDQMVEDVMAWLKSLPGNNQPPDPVSENCEDPAEEDFLACGEEIFDARCAVCHGPEGQGKENKAKVASMEDPETGDTIDVKFWYQGQALWKGDVKHLSLSQHKFTVVNGRRLSWMPAFSEAPPQGTPIPPYPLTESQIDAVVAYERTL